MKGIILASLATTTILGMALGQGSIGSDYGGRYKGPYDPKTTPPLGISEAYSVILSHMGDDTNRFYCVSAGCLEKTRGGVPGWTFWFSNTNGGRGYMEASFDKLVTTDPRILFGHGQNTGNQGVREQEPFCANIPPLGLADAYTAVLKHIGVATNSFYCVSANCLEFTNNGFAGWTFSFSNTNGQRGRVNVHFDGQVETVAKPDEILIPK